jgi:hypothetical protein
VKLREMLNKELFYEYWELTNKTPLFTNIDDYGDNALQDYFCEFTDKYIGNGCSRVAFNIGEYVLKVALSHDGIEANLNECNFYNTVDAAIKERIANIKYYSKGYRCLIVENVPNEFIPTEENNDELDCFWKKCKTNYNFRLEDIEGDNIKMDNYGNWKIVDYEFY